MAETKDENVVASHDPFAWVGETVRDKRLAKGWSQQELGGKAGVDVSIVERIEGGEAGDVPLDQLMAINLRLGILLIIELVEN